MPHFDIPLNLPHAGRVAARIVSLLEDRAAAAANASRVTDARFDSLFATAANLEMSLRPYRVTDDDPDDDEALPVRTQAAELGRELTQQIAAARIGDDRLGQCVRNLFECLEMGEEGALLGLQAGENPHSLQRPV